MGNKASGDTAPNPDFPDDESKTLYKCWDSCVEINEDESGCSLAVNMNSGLPASLLLKHANNLFGTRMHTHINLHLDVACFGPLAKG